MTSLPIHKVVVIGASGNVGRSTVKALLEEGFQVTGVTRESSQAILPAEAKHLKIDFSEESLREAFNSQDAVVSTISSISSGGDLLTQKSFIDAAIASKVKVFIPSEYGIDTSDRASSRYIPFLADKIETLDYLKANDDRISWTALITGSLFDWGLRIPGFGGWNVPARTVTIFDGGEIPYEATNLDQVGRAIAKSLKAPELTRNQYVYVNSFTTTQNEILKILEEVAGEKIAVSQGTVEGLWQDGTTQCEQGQPYGVLAQIAGAIYGKGGLANYSATKGLWNERLGLAQESLKESLKRYLAEEQ